MGGNIFPNSIRIDRRAYDRISIDLEIKLGTIFPGRAFVVPSYGNKQTFGDIDILVEKRDAEDRTQLLIETFAIPNLNKNGPVWSFLYQNIQIDLIFVPTKIYNFSYFYFAWNDLGNLIGRIAHKFKLKFGHAGLLYIVREGTHSITEITITTNFGAALEILGYNPDTFYRGFNDLESIFKFAASTPYFNSDLYLLANRSHHARVRDKKRKTYMQFLGWLRTQENLPEFQYTDFVINSKLINLLDQFPEFSLGYIHALEQVKKQKEVKKKFNGKLVMELTKLQNKTLGIFIQQLKHKFDSPDDFTTFILESDSDRIKTFILKNFDTYVTMP